MKNASGSTKSWRGTSTEVVVEPVRHRWQSDSASLERSLIKSQQRSLRARLITFSLMLLVMVSTFVALLLWGPSKTPLISVAAINYNWPLPPNAWALEDVQALASLNAKNIDWRDTNATWLSSSEALNDLRLQINSATLLAQRSGTLIVYINMHGAVNDQQEPCLITPGGSPLAPDEWIKLRDVAAMLPRDESRLHTLLVLDCVDEQVNWNAGIVQSTFAQRVIDWVDAQEQANFSVLLSAAPQQQSWSGSDLQGSIFGQAFRLALAGAADDAKTNASLPSPIKSPDSVVQSISRSGNGDGVVSLHELVNYVQREVDQWTSTHRGNRQTPLLVAKEGSDKSLARALRGRELRRMVNAAGNIQLAAAVPTVDEMSTLWRMLDKLRGQQCYRYEPRAWADLEHQLLWLDKLSVSGSAYTEQAMRTLYPELSKRLKESLERATTASPENLTQRSKVLTNQPLIRLDKSQLPSLSWLEFIDAEPMDVASVRSRSASWLTAESPESFPAWLASQGITPEMLVPNELNFAALAQREQCARAWANPSVPQQLCDYRNRCEQLVVLGDVRGHRLRRSSLQKLDQARRQVEDQLFVGPQATGGQPMDMSMAEQVLQQAEADRALVDEALQLRDRGLAEVPYLAAWICSPHNDMSNLGDWLSKDNMAPTQPAASVTDLGSQTRIDPLLREQLAIQRLDRLTKNLAELGNQLSSATFDGAASLSDLKNISDTIGRDLAAMNQLVQDHVQRAQVRPATDVRNLAQIQSLLELPTLAADQRVALRKKLDEQLAANTKTTEAETAPPAQADQLLSEIQKKVNSQTDSETKGALESVLLTASASNPYSYRMDKWPIHPLTGLLGTKSGHFSMKEMEQTAQATAAGSSETRSVDVLNSRLRSHFRTVSSFSTQQLTAWLADSSLDIASETLRDAWPQAVVAANLERMLLPICPVRAEGDATAFLLGQAIKDQMLWYAERSLDDFYADGRKVLGQRVESAGYFDLVVQRMLQVIAQFPSLNDDSSTLKQLNDRLDILRALARNGLRATVKSSMPDPKTQQVGIEVSVQPTLAVMTSGQTLWPEGTATVALREANGTLSAARGAVGIPVSASGARVALAASTGQTGPDMDAVIVFRGHEFRAPLNMGEGMLVDFQPTQFDWAQVTLFGDRAQQPSIVFILDCSWSMGEPMPVEALDATTQSRLELAKTHVLQLMEQLATSGEARIGLRLFGHRLGWSRPVDPKTGNVKGSSQVIPQPNYLRSIPDEVVPSRDVEAVVPLGRFTTEMMGGLSKTLASVIPWGQSPLYLSIVEAFKDFGADNQTTTKSIVIITDGDNFQFNGNRQPGGNSGTQTSVDDVLVAWQSTKVPLYILGVGIEDKADSSGSNPRATLKKLAERTGGEYYDIDNGSDLLRALAEQTSTASYAIERVGDSGDRARARQPDALESRLNELTEINGIDGSQAMRLTFQSISKDFVVEGGESLEMLVSDDGQDVRASAYDVQTPKAGVLTHTGDPNLIVRAHRPLPQTSGVLFPVSFQDPLSHFTPRPKESWIEVMPVQADGQPMRRVYLFYDANYDARTPVPRQSWLASDWPKAAPLADVRVWARYDQSPVSAVLSMRQLRDESTKWTAGSPIIGLQDVTLRVVVQETSAGKGLWQLHVSEMHGPQSRGIGSIRIHLDNGGQPKPERITRRFDSENRMAVHTFEYELEAGRSLLGSDSARLTIATRENALDGGYQLQGGQAIRVEIAQTSDLLPLPSN